MIRAFVKYLLCTCIILFCGHNVMHAHVIQNYLPCSYANTSVLPEQNVASVQYHSANLFRLISSGSEKENYDLKALVVYDDDDDDKLISSKKYSENNSYSTSIFFDQTAGQVSGFGKIIQTFNNDLSHTSSRYIIYQVFRI